MCFFKLFETCDVIEPFHYYFCFSEIQNLRRYDEGITIGGEDSPVKLGEVSIDVSAFVNNEQGDASTATWEFRGVVRGEASFGSDAVGANLGAQVAFDTSTNEWEVIATVEVRRCRLTSG